jgi:uncharacterized protein (UPF0276 family)
MHIGTTYFGGEPLLLDRMMPLVDFIETTPDSIAEIRNRRAAISLEVLDELRTIAASKRLLVHGIGLSIGSCDGFREEYLALVDEILDVATVAWHSEHLAWTHAGGEATGTMFVLPRLADVVDLICERVETIQQRYALPFLLENVVNLIPEYPESDFSPAGFLNEITRRTGCGILLDAYNLECEMHNQGLDVRSFFDELDFAAVREIHIANGAEYRGLMLDVHSRRTRAATLAIADEIVARATNAEVLVYEVLPQAVQPLGYDAIIDELTMLRSRYAS